MKDGQRNEDSKQPRVGRYQQNILEEYSTVERLRTHNVMHRKVVVNATMSKNAVLVKIRVHIHLMDKKMDRDFREKRVRYLVRL